MAHADRIKPPPVDLPPDEIVLTLSEDEAQTLLTLTGHVGGDATRGRRGHTDEIAHALVKAKVSYLNSDAVVKNKRTTGSIYFYNNDGTTPDPVSEGS